MMSVQRRIAGAAVGVALALAGCSSGGGDDAGTAEAAAQATSESASPAPETETGSASPSETEAGSADGSTTPDREFLAVDTLEGARFDPAATQDKGVILWFWAPWCTICRGEAPEVAAVAAELEESGSPVVVLGVPGRGQVPEMEDFVADTGTGAMTHLVDVEGVLWRDFGVVTQPAFALLGTDGEVEVVNGALGEDGLREAAAALADG
ncbi:MAG: redoxin domain-containing protein [Dermatophilaceae bacterium]